jgi:hypothetical protein
MQVCKSIDLVIILPCLTVLAAQTQNDPQSTLYALTATLRHRQDSILYDIEDTVEDFHHQLSTLRIDALEPLRSAFVGQLMEDTYQSANMERGMYLFKRLIYFVTT